MSTLTESQISRISHEAGLAAKEAAITAANPSGGLERLIDAAVSGQRPSRIGPIQLDPPSIFTMIVLTTCWAQYEPGSEVGALLTLAALADPQAMWLNLRQQGVRLGESSTPAPDLQPVIDAAMVWLYESRLTPQQTGQIMQWLGGHVAAQRAAQGSAPESGGSEEPGKLIRSSTSNEVLPSGPTEPPLLRIGGSFS
jgi:hypothetical protein